MAQQGRFDLAQFDAEAANLDLAVPPPDELNLPIGQPPHDVAGFVKSGQWRVISG
jgi:hypothetical protein